MGNSTEFYNTLITLGTKRTMFNLFKQNNFLFDLMDNCFPYLLFTDGIVGDCEDEQSNYLSCYRTMRLLLNTKEETVKVILRMIESDMFVDNKIRKYCIKNGEKFIMTVRLPIREETMDNICKLLVDIELVLENNRSVDSNILEYIKSSLQVLSSNFNSSSIITSTIDLERLKIKRKELIEEMERYIPFLS